MKSTSYTPLSGWRRLLLAVPLALLLMLALGISASAADKVLDVDDRTASYTTKADNDKITFTATFAAETTAFVINVAHDGVTIDGEDQTLTNVYIVVDTSDTDPTLTLKDLTLTAPDAWSALSFTEPATLNIDGTVSLTGGSLGGHGISSNDALTIIGTGTLTATGGDELPDATGDTGGTGISAGGALTIGVNTTATGGTGSSNGNGGTGIDVRGFGDLVLNAAITLTAQGGEGGGEEGADGPDFNFGYPASNYISVKATPVTIVGSGHASPGVRIKVENTVDNAALTLEDLDLRGGGIHPALYFDGETGGHTLNVEGTVSLTGGTGKYALISHAALTIAGDGTLTATGGDSDSANAGTTNSGISVQGDFTIQADVTAQGGSPTTGYGGAGIHVTNGGKLVLYKADVTLTSKGVTLTSKGGTGTTPGPDFAFVTPATQYISVEATDVTIIGSGNASTGVRIFVEDVVDGTLNLENLDLTASADNRALDKRALYVHDSTNTSNTFTLNITDTVKLTGGEDYTGADGERTGITSTLPLTITGDGELVATGGAGITNTYANGGAGISANSLTVQANVTAQGGAATGGGSGGIGVSVTNSNLTLGEGGTLTAKGGAATGTGNGGAGILVYNNSNSIMLTAKGVTLTAEGGASTGTGTGVFGLAAVANSIDFAATDITLSLTNGTGASSVTPITRSVDGSWAVTPTDALTDGSATDKNIKVTTSETETTIKLSTPKQEGGGGGGGGSTTALVSTMRPENGSFTFSPKEPRKGDVVTITPKPDAGFEVDTVIAHEQAGIDLTVKDNGDGSYSFTYRGTPVVLSVLFKEAEKTPDPDPDPAHPFKDVKATDWYYADVLYLYERGLMTGIAGDEFGVDQRLTRGMLATILWRMAGQPAPEGSSDFTDLTQDWYRVAVAWAEEKGIVLGFDEDTFGPDEEITREQLAVMLYRFAALMKYDITATADISHFTDAGEISGYAEEAIRWAVAVGILTGYEDGSLKPGGDATRAEAAAMLHRFIEKFMEPAAEA